MSTKQLMYNLQLKTHTCTYTDTHTHATSDQPLNPWPTGDDGTTNKKTNKDVETYKYGFVIHFLINCQVNF